MHPMNPMSVEEISKLWNACVVHNEDLNYDDLKRLFDTVYARDREIESLKLDIDTTTQRIAARAEAAEDLVSRVNANATEWRHRAWKFKNALLKIEPYVKEKYGIPEDVVATMTSALSPDKPPVVEPEIEIKPGDRVAQNAATGEVVAVGESLEDCLADAGAQAIAYNVKYSRVPPGTVASSEEIKTALKKRHDNEVAFARDNAPPIDETVRLRDAVTDLRQALLRFMTRDPDAHMKALEVEMKTRWVEENK